ncbi:MAG TPA: hypothetical protein VF198_16360 [Vicinamibacterales bacterium]
MRQPRDGDVHLAPLQPLERRDAGAARREGHLQTLPPVVAARVRDVVPGELRLVRPAQLHRQGLGGHRRPPGHDHDRRGRQRQEAAHHRHGGPLE